MRIMLMVVTLFAVSFFGVRWVTQGGPIPALRIVDLKPDPRIETWEQRSRRHVAEDRDQEWLESKTAQGDGDPERTKLREAVVETATAFRLSPCNDALKKKYIEAAAAYARAFAVLGGCPNFPICRPNNDAEMENAKKVFKLDVPPDAVDGKADGEAHAGSDQCYGQMEARAAAVDRRTFVDLVPDAIYGGILRFARGRKK